MGFFSSFPSGTQTRRGLHRREWGLGILPLQLQALRHRSTRQPRAERADAGPQKGSSSGVLSKLKEPGVQVQEQSRTREEGDPERCGGDSDSNRLGRDHQAQHSDRSSMRQDVSLSPDVLEGSHRTHEVDSCEECSHRPRQVLQQPHDEGEPRMASA